MSCGINTANTRLAPMAAGATGTARDDQAITGAGNVSRPTTIAMTVGAYATLAVGPTYGIRVRFGSTTPTAVTTDTYFGPGTIYDWYVTNETKMVAAIDVAGTAANTIEYHVWQSSPNP